MRGRCWDPPLAGLGRLGERIGCVAAGTLPRGVGPAGDRIGGGRPWRPYGARVGGPGDPTRPRGRAARGPGDGGGGGGAGPVRLRPGRRGALQSDLWLYQEPEELRRERRALLARPPDRGR